MSRTYRRQKGYMPRYVKEAALPLPYHETIGLNPEKYGRWYEFREGQWFHYSHKQRDQYNACWFGDHGYAWQRRYGKDVRKRIRSLTQTKHRAEARMELIRFQQNPDYEVQIPRKNLLPWD